MAYRISDLTQATSTTASLGSREIELGGSGLGSKRLSLAALRTALLIGSAALGFTAADPIAAGAATFTTISGDGASITALNATQLTSGTVPDARLSTNVPLKNAANTFTATNTFAGVIATTVTASGLVLANAGATVASGQTLTINSITISGIAAWASPQPITISTPAQPSITSLGTINNLSLSGTVSGAPAWASPQPITLSTAAQPNITSVGTLTSLTLSGAISGVTTLATSGAINSQTISAATSFTGSVTVANGFTVSAGTSSLQSMTAASGTFTGLVTVTVTGKMANFVGTNGSNSYIGFDNTPTAGGKKWRLGYSGGTGSSVTTFDILNETDNVTVFILSATGGLTLASTITTANPGSGAGAWKFGKKVAGAGLGIVTNNYVEVEIDGSLVKLAEAA